MTTKSSAENLIPILIAIDAEPDGVFISPTERVPWTGVEKSRTVVRKWREDLEQATGRAVHFIWLLRMDFQVEKVYGSSRWGVDRYGGFLEEMRRQGDEVGLHVHPYRLADSGDSFIADFGDQDWVEHCIQLARIMQKP